MTSSPGGTPAAPSVDQDRARVWRIGLAGLGVVGQGLVRLVADRPDFAPGGGSMQVTSVSARDRNRPRDVDVSAATWFNDPVALAASSDIDVFVELIGGADGPAKTAVETALAAGKPVITANKALIAKHGKALAALAESKGVPLLYEAAVMGGTPAVKMLREGLVGDRVTRVAGILNGTCNFILSEMEAREQPFAQVLADAQARGFAEADPTTDVGGFDAGHKIAILAALAFDAAPNFDAVEIEGIDRVDLIDIHLAHELGYRIKLIASASRQGDGASVRVRPGLVPLNHPLAQAGGALNALFIEGARIGRIFLQGPGAGAGPTAAAVAADLADLTAGVTRPVFQRPAGELDLLAAAAKGQRHERAYIRLMVKDRAGVLASITDALARSDVSIDSFLQRPAQASGVVPVVLTTHEASEGALQQAGEMISSLEAVLERPRIFRIEDV